MNPFSWFKSLSRAEPVSLTAASIRRELQGSEQQRIVTIRQRDLISLNAIDDEASAQRWQHLDATISELDKRIEVLAGALPLAETLEAEAAARAEAASRTEFEQTYSAKTAEAQKFVDGVLARLPTGDELTTARDLRDALGSGAAHMRGWTNAVTARRPLNPLEAIHDALTLRVQRIERSRRTGTHPITLASKNTQDVMATAVSRVTALERTNR